MNIGKTIFTTLSLSAMAFGFASCSQEEIENPVTGDGNVNFTVELESAPAQTRAFGDGYSATTLNYAVYDADTEEVVIPLGSGRFSNSLETKVSLNLADGKKYKIAFFAYYNTNNIFSFNGTDKKVTIDYSKMARNDRDYDCFYALKEIEVKGPITESVTLTRPMAQINWGTSDINLPAVQKAYSNQWGSFLLYTNIQAKVYNTLNIFTGEAEGELTEVTASSNTRPIDTQYGSFPIDGYDWLKMTYVLVPKDASLMDITLQTFNTSTATATPIATVDVANVPVQRNYRTNIYGALLSNKADITVTKEPIFAGYNDREVWDGTAGTVKPDADGNYAINTPSELAAIAKLVNDGNKLQGKTVKLNRDLDLNNINWTPISNSTDKTFDGNFDGCGHTIKNLYINQNSKAATPAGLFGRIWNGTTEIKNLKIEGVTIDVTGCIGKPEAAAAVLAVGNVKSISNVEVSDVNIKAAHYAGGIAGNFYGDVTDCKATDVNIALQFYDKGTVLDYGDKAGGIFGLHGEGAGYNISGNSVKNVTISGYRDLGGCFGMLNENNKYSNNTAENVTITGILNDKAYDENTPAGNFDGIVGRTGNNVSDEGGNNATGVTIYEANAQVTNVTELQTAVSKGGFVQIAADITVPGSAEITKPTTIHVMEGKTITLNGAVTNNSELTIDGKGTIQGANGYLITNTGTGTLIINDGTLLLTETQDSYQAPVYSEGSVIVNGGTFENVNGNAMRFNWAQYGLALDKTVEINGGTFRSNGNYALNIYGAAKPGCKAIIRGGTFIGATAGARADNGVEVTIEGGTFIGKGKYHGFCAGAESTGSQNCIVTVKGGNFYGTIGHALCRANSATLIVKGGYVNKTTGFEPATGFGLVDADRSVTVDGVEYKFTKQIVKQ